MHLGILGGGESGTGTALLASRQGDVAFLSERGALPPDTRRELESAGVAYEEGGHDLGRLLDCDTVVKSPGIPDSAEPVQRLRQAGVPVISEIEYAARHTEATLIGITGSNGKTTTTRLIGHLLRAGGIDAAMAGNLGPSFARRLTDAPHAYYVLELSSFQLDGIVDFRPHIGLLLNITPDHLDRYEQRMDLYIRAKFRLIENQQPEDLFLYNADDPNISGYLARRAAPRAETVGLRADALQEGKVEVEPGQRVDLGGTRLLGRHNAMNALFACTVARRLGVGYATLQAGLESFVPVPHRLERVGTIRGVDFVNDSKATNVDAAFYALEAMRQPIVWIVGGQDKGNDYSSLHDLVAQKVRAIVALGADNRKIIRAFGAAKPLLEARGAEAAVEMALELAEPGDVVLLSPACASFDLFNNFEDRGDQFRTAVQQRMDPPSS